MTLRYFLENGTTTRDKTPLKDLGATKGESRGVAMMPKTRLKVEQDYSVFNYGPPRPHKNVNCQYINIAPGTEVNLETKFVLPGKSKEKVGR